MHLALSFVVALAVPAPQGDVGGSLAPALEQPRRTEGVGLLTVGALAGAAGLGLGLASASDMASLENCVDCPRRLPPTMFAAVALNTASLGLLAAGAGLRGRLRGSHDAVRGPSRGAGVPWISLGSLITASGVLLVAGGLGWQFAESSRASETPWMLLQLGLSSVVGGSALLVYGLTYQRYRWMFRGARLGMAPHLGERQIGLALVGRF
ncbi:hypothetical protein [Nannocystis pusilla]|uniref:hypothetical protein n=1 Tax=Nannocystis pusilla TaxID=889268 RepID=UPI003DA46EA8